MIITHKNYYSQEDRHRQLEVKPTIEEQLRFRREEVEEQMRRKREVEQKEMEERRKVAAKGIKRFRERVRITEKIIAVLCFNCR